MVARQSWKDHLHYKEVPVPEGLHLQNREIALLDTMKRYNLETPPNVLYYGVGLQFLNYVMKEGLKQTKDKYIQLFKDKKDALEAGKKQGGESRVLSVDALKLHNGGYKVYVDDKGVWYTREIPKDYISIISNRKDV